MRSRSGVLLLVAGILLCCLISCDVWAGEDPTSENKTGVAGCLVEQSIPAFQRDLLDLAFETATAIPVRPHIKARSRAQEAVIAISLKLDQPRLAHGYIEMIDNWRRGAGYADLAFYCAQHGKAHEARHYLHRAHQIARDSTIEAWRRDRIRVEIAKTYLWLGQPRQAEQLAAGVVESETGKVARVKATLSDTHAYHEQIKALDALNQRDNYDITKNALDAYAELFDRFYEDVERRSQVETKIKTSIGKLPIWFRIHLLMELAESAWDHADQVKALELVNEAQAMTDAYQWPPRYGLPLRARLAELRAQTGDKQKARANADAVLARVDAARDQMIDIDRAGALRPLAEAYQSMGDTAAALAVYKRVVEEGAVNPNSRPRAEDLSATCGSMALHSVEPDATLWERMRQIRQGLGSPW